MPHICIWSSGYKFAFRAVNQLPPFPHYHKPDQDKPVTDEMDDRHHLPTASEECEPEMSACMGERVQYRISAAEYACEDVDCEWKAVHLGKQRHKEGESHAHGSPLSLFDRRKVTQDEEGKKSDVNKNKKPESISIRNIFTMHGYPPISGPHLLLIRL